MNTLVVFDTQFGNTEQVAHAIGKALEAAGPVQVVPVAEAARLDLSDVDLLVVGGPTQAHRARKELRDWIDSIPTDTLRNLAIAAFDTRISWPMIFSGSAANTIEHVVERRRARLATPPESFIVTDSEGPLAEGELERAAGWAEELMKKVAGVEGARLIS